MPICYHLGATGVKWGILEYAATSSDGGALDRRTHGYATLFPAFSFFLLGETFEGSDELFQLLFLPPLEAAFFPFPFTLLFLMHALARVA
jgi:hypothetical protein